MPAGQLDSGMRTRRDSLVASLPNMLRGLHGSREEQTT
jgi:hypothetical protein